MKLSSVARAALFPLALSLMPLAQAANIVATASTPFLLNGDYYTFTGTGTFAYTSNKKSNDKLAGITITGMGGAVYSSTANSTVAQEASLILDSAGNILGSASTGGERQVAPEGTLMDGGTLDVTNLGFDPSTMLMYADVSGVDAAGVAHTASRLGFFKVASVSGATRITGAGTFTQTLSNLTLTTAGLAMITETLGLGGLAESVTKSTNFGTVTAKFVVTKAAVVPEASTMAMMLLGLGGLATLRARRQA
jgi:PEP-CTERM motif